MRAVATRLAVTPMAVYYYVDDKDALLRLAVERVSALWGPLGEAAGDWQAALRSHLLATWQELTRYPGLSSYMMGQANISVTAQTLQSGIRFFEDAGFSPKSARLAWSFAMTYIHGRISVDARLGHRPDAVRLDGLRARDYVEFGVDAVIRALEELRLGELATSPAIGSLPA